VNPILDLISSAVPSPASIDRGARLSPKFYSERQGITLSAVRDRPHY